MMKTLEALSCVLGCDVFEPLWYTALWKVFWIADVASE